MLKQRSFEDAASFQKKRHGNACESQMFLFTSHLSGEDSTYKSGIRPSTGGIRTSGPAQAAAKRRCKTHLQLPECLEASKHSLPLGTLVYALSAALVGDDQFGSNIPFVCWARKANLRMRPGCVECSLCDLVFIYRR